MQSKLTHPTYQILVASVILLWSVLCTAIEPSKAPFCSALTEQQTNKALSKLYSTIHQDPDLGNRIAFYSELFVGKPYALTALGEGPKGEFDQAPLYRLDAFDCQTYVETIMALALSHSVKDFATCLQSIRYHNGNISYIDRNHFVSTDWNHNNHQQHTIQDITLTITDQKHHAIAKYAHAIINVPNWYKHFDLHKIRRCDASPEEADRYLKKLQHLGQNLRIKKSTIAYLPFSALFDKQGHANHFIFDQIPNGAIVEIVRPNWNLTPLIGTNLNVSHLGFAIRKNGSLYYYQALASAGFVIKPSLVEYLSSIRAQSSIKGINIQQVLPVSECHTQEKH